MPRVLFVCHGNICRSTMAQSVMQYLVERAGVADAWTIDSAATSTEEIGAPPHTGTRTVLAAHGIPLVPHRARQIRRNEYDAWDLIIYMDAHNKRALMRLFDNDPHKRLDSLLSFAPPAYAGRRRDVADPWYTGNFALTFDDVMASCEGLLETWEDGDLGC